ncbi:MAG TPA: hypothetical protein VKB39_04530 [Candidatus Baltobacteraceae bacterium]|nr:hypothetical protein [Candidatus Baltobacteraceae bacterium]
MRIPAVATVVALSVFLTGAISSTDDCSAIIAAVDARNSTLPNFTFHADVGVKMHHFPWLRFHLSGDGTYEKGNRYWVHFTQMPFFAKQVHDIDLSMLDPTLWPKNYTYTAVGIDGDDALFDLQALHDPNLEKARVALNNQGADWVDATYKDGMHIHMAITPAQAGSYLLPGKMDVSIDYPHMPLSATADFSAYNFDLALH